MAGLDFESFRLLLRDRSIPWAIEAQTSAQMDRAAEQFLGEPRG